MDITNNKNLIVYSTIQVVASNTNEISCGTGFFVGKHQTNCVYLATNKHVVSKYDHAEFTFCERTEKDEPIDRSHITIVVDDLQARIINHPDPDVDLCFISLDDKIEAEKRNGRNPFYTVIGDNLIISPSQINEMSAIERVLMVGYPAGLIDEVNNKPIVRVGTTATCISLDFEG